MALAFQQYEDTLCSGCGQPVHESMDPDNERRYVSDYPSRCHACTALGQRMDEYRGENVSQPQALRFGVQLKRPSKGVKN